jgi:hypothetical protein
MDRLHGVETVAGLCIGLVPDFVAAEAIRKGKLRDVLPNTVALPGRCSPCVPAADYGLPMSEASSQARIRAASGGKR